MSTISKIQWTDRTWNPIRGCSLVSPGCTNCYAMRQAHRFSGKGQPYEDLTRTTEHGPVWTGKVNLVESELDAPIRWQTPRRVFVNSMSDLFHEDVPEDFLDKVFVVMALAPRHTFQVLTKRPERMLAYLSKRDGYGRTARPLPNVWFGVSVEDRNHIDRIDVLQQVPAAVRFVSFEPLLGDIGPVHLDGIHWAIFGGESGPGARLCDVNWIREGMYRCRSYGVRVFVKQIGAKAMGSWGWGGSYRGESNLCYPRDRKGGDPSEWAEDLRVREWPEYVTKLTQTRKSGCGHVG